MSKKTNKTKAAGKAARFVGRVAARTLQVGARALGGAAAGTHAALSEMDDNEDRETRENPKVRKKRRNPSTDMVDMIRRWHWDAYESPRFQDVETPSWMPEEGIKLGRLHSMVIDGGEVEVPQRPAHYLVAGLRPGVRRPPIPEGKRAREQWYREHLELFVAPPLPVEGEGSLERIRYIALKGDDDAIWDHPLTKPYPRVVSQDGCLDIVRGESKYWIDPDAGIRL